MFFYSVCSFLKKVIMNIRIVIKILVLLVTINSCSNDDSLLNCFQEENRKIEARFTDLIGEIDNDGCQSNYTIIGISTPPNIYLPLAPCNLSEEFKEDGLKVRFSGYMYETFETEDICAMPFEITKMELE